jgi:hypothetical protein
MKYAPLNPSEAMEWADVAVLVSKVYDMDTEDWEFRKHIGSRAKRYTHPRAIMCYIATHELGLGWRTGRVRAAIAYRLDVPNQNTIHTSVRTARTVLSRTRGIDRLAMREVLRSYCEIKGMDLENLLPQVIFGQQQNKR